MKKVFLVIVFMIPLLIFSQEIKFTSIAGYATIKTDKFKKVALSTGAFIGSEFILKEFLYLNTLVGISTIRFENMGLPNSFTTKYYLSIPVSLKKYYPISKRSSLYWDFGLSFNYDFITQNEIFTVSGIQKNNQNGLGTSFSVIGAVGFKTQVTKRLFFDIGLFGQTDYLLSYKKETDKIKTDRRMISLTFYKKLKK